MSKLINKQHCQCNVFILLKFTMVFIFFTPNNKYSLAPKRVYTKTVQNALWWILLPYIAIKIEVIPLCYIKRWNVEDRSEGCNKKYDKDCYIVCLSKPNLKFLTKWSKHSGVTWVPKQRVILRICFCTLITDLWSTW